MADNFKLVWTPEGASAREWSFNLQNPTWDIRVQTEKVTDWPWARFNERLLEGSGIAMQALLWVLRKRDEPKLALSSVEPDFDELDPQFLCPDCKQWLNDDNTDDEGGHGCPGSGDDDEPAEAAPGEA